MTLLFLEASEEALVRRFSETRRPHPMASAGPLIDSIREERELLGEIRSSADLVFDTSEWSIHDIRHQVYREFGVDSDAAPGFSVTLVSFGFKYGIPYGTDLLFDVRFLPNPHFEPELRELTGKDAEVLEFLGREPEFEEILSRIGSLLLYLLPKYRDELRSRLSVAVGCTGGKHRSVGLCERLRSALEADGWSARLVHRDIQR